MSWSSELIDAINNLYKVKYGDFVNAKDMNTLVRAVSLLVNIINNIFNRNIVFGRVYVKKDDIIEPSHQNNLVNALKEIGSVLVDVFGNINEVNNILDILDKLRVVSYGDYVLDTDHNDLVDAVKSIANLLIIRVLEGVWNTYGQNKKRNCQQLYGCKRIFIGRPKVATYSIDPDGNVVWKTTDYGVVSQDSYGNLYILYNYLSSYSYEGVLNWKLYISVKYTTCLNSCTISNRIIDFGDIYVASDVGYIYRVDKYGNILWYVSYMSGQTNQSPLLDDEDKIYLCGYIIGDYTYIYCIDCYGNLIWKTTLCPSATQGTVAMDDNGNLYVHVADYCLASVTKDGIVRWKIGAGLDTKAHVSIKDNDFLYDISFTYYRAVSLDGIILWSFRGYNTAILVAGVGITSKGIGLTKDWGVYGDYFLVIIYPDGSHEYHWIGVSIFGEGCFSTPVVDVKNGDVVYTTDVVSWLGKITLEPYTEHWWIWIGGSVDYDPLSQICLSPF